jgi:hypothetical protein
MNHDNNVRLLRTCCSSVLLSAAGSAMLLFWVKLLLIETSTAGQSING